MVNPNVPKAVTYPSPNEWPVTVFAISNITQAAPAQVTAVGTGITLSPNASVPVVDFSQVKGMTQINGKFAYVTSVIDADNFTIGLDTSQFYPYTSGGFVNITGGSPPIDPLTNLF